MRALVERHLAAFDAHDTAAVAATLAPDVVWVTGEDRVEGLRAVSGLFDDWLWSLDPRLEVLSWTVDGDRVALQAVEHLRVDGVARADGIAVFLEVRDGLLARVTVYRAGSADVT